MAITITALSICAFYFTRALLQIYVGKVWKMVSIISPFMICNFLKCTIVSVQRRKFTAGNSNQHFIIILISAARYIRLQGRGSLQIIVQNFGGSLTQLRSTVKCLTVNFDCCFPAKCHICKCHSINHKWFFECRNTV